MSFLFYAINLLVLVSFMVFVRQVARAPEGHEDNLGFHFDEASQNTALPVSAVVRHRTARAGYAQVTTRHLAA